MENVSGFISVIVPVYNSEKYLEKCLESIINQTYKKLEIILIDDGSIDESGKICDEYAKKDSRIKVIHKKNEGVSAARNQGLEIATGEYIAFVDSDDWIEEEMYEEMIEQAKINNADIVRCAQIFEYSNKSVKDENVLIDNSYIDVKSDKSYFINLILDCGVMPSFFLLLIRKDIVDKFNIRFNNELIIGEDLLFVLTLLCNIDVMYIYKKFFYHYNIHEQSAMNSMNKNAQNSKNLLILYNEINNLLEKNDINMLEKTSRYIFYRIYYRIADTVIYEKNKSIIEYFINNDVFNNLIGNVDKNKLSIFGKVFLKLFMTKKTNILYLYCYIFSWLRKIKKGAI